MRDGLGRVRSVLVLGGASEIGVAIAARLAGRPDAHVVLAGRHPETLDQAAVSLRGAGAGHVDTIPFDAGETSAHAGVVAEAVRLAGDLDVVVVAFGVLGDGIGIDDPAGAVEVASTNFVGGVSAGLVAARQLRRQGHGTIVVLSSVAGVRVRKANYVYGATKAGLDGFAQGLGDALDGSGVDVLVVRPGFVHGRMTEGMAPAPFATTPAAVADAVVAGLTAGHPVVWVPGGLRAVFAVFRLAPRRVWRRLPG